MFVRGENRIDLLKGSTIAVAAMASSLGVNSAANAQTSANQSEVGSEAETADDSGIGVIVVTARKRSENLQDTPISISAFSEDGLIERGISNVSDVDNLTPNLTFQRSAAQSGDKSAAQIFIRGVGQTDFTLTTDPGVGLYLDGVYIARSIGSALDVLDVERIEVLRGPQGTLFGRNTIGGAISITSKKPDALEAFGEATVTLGSFDRLDVKASANIPLGENLAASASILRKTSDGYIRRPNLGDKTGEDDLWAGRLALRWEPSDRLSLDFSADGTIIRETSCCSELVAVYPGVLTGFHNAVVAPTLVGELGPAAFYDQNSLPTEEFIDNAGFSRPAELDLFGLSLTAEYEVSDAVTLKSITAFRSFESINGGDFDHTPLAINETINTFENDQFSQEIQLLGSLWDDRLNFILGGYFFSENGFNQDAVNFSIVRLISGGFTDNQSIAAFGQTTFDITDDFSLTAGLRWTKDTKKFLPRQSVVENPAGVPSQVLSTPGNLVILQPGDPLVPSVEVEQSIKDATPYVNLGYKVTPDILLYASYSEGFKSGGFVQRIFPDRLDVPSFEPEKVKVYEAGFKFISGDRRIRFNGAAFSTDYTDLQVQVFDGIAPVTQNAAAARIRGFEAELTLEPVDELLIEAGVGYLDAKYTEIDPGATEVALTNGLVNAPEWSLSAGLSYGFDVGSNWTLRPRVDWNYRSRTFNDARNTAELVQPGYHVINAGLTLESLDDNWRITLVGKNLTDKRYIQSGFADEAVQSVGVATFGRPAEWELSVTRRF